MIAVHPPGSPRAPPLPFPTARPTAAYDTAFPRLRGEAAADDWPFRRAVLEHDARVLARIVRPLARDCARARGADDGGAARGESDDEDEGEGTEDDNDEEDDGADDAPGAPEGAAGAAAGGHGDDEDDGGVDGLMRYHDDVGAALAKAQI